MAMRRLGSAGPVLPGRYGAAYMCGFPSGRGAQVCYRSSLFSRQLLIARSSF
jgi:hypothetical protein